MGILREDGSPKPAAEEFDKYTPDLGICQWFHYEDHRLDEAVGWMRRLGVKHLRTGLSWADSFRPNALAWFDRQMEALEEFDVTVTFCFTPEHRGIAPHHTSAPHVKEEFAEFCAAMIRRYATGRSSTEESLAVACRRVRWPGGRSFGDTGTERSCGRLVEPRRSRIDAGIAVVVAHPDDEHRLRMADRPWLDDPTVIHVTDVSAPGTMADAHSRGSQSAEAYAIGAGARVARWWGAMDLAGLRPTRLSALGWSDQDASLHPSSSCRAAQRRFSPISTSF
jgi:hypothetical protein